MQIMQSLIGHAPSQLRDAASFFTDRSQTPDARAVRGLGIASILIGLTEILMPRRLERAMGIGNDQNTGILRVLGVREIGHGISILAEEDPAPGVYWRVAGDALDGVLLFKAALRTRKPGGFATIAAMTTGIMALDLFFAARLAKRL